MFYYVVCHTHFSVRATCLEQKHIFIKVLKVSFLDMKLIKDQVKMLKCCKTDPSRLCRIKIGDKTANE